MVSLLAVLGKHRTLLTSTDSIYSGPTPNHNTSTMQDALLDRGLVLYSVGGGGGFARARQQWRALVAGSSHSEVKS